MVSVCPTEAPSANRHTGVPLKASTPVRIRLGAPILLLHNECGFPPSGLTLFGFRGHVEKLHGFSHCPGVRQIRAQCPPVPAVNFADELQGSIYRLLRLGRSKMVESGSGASVVIPEVFPFVPSPLQLLDRVSSGIGSHSVLHLGVVMAPIIRTRIASLQPLLDRGQGGDQVKNRFFIPTQREIHVALHFVRQLGIWRVAQQKVEITEITIGIEFAVVIGRL